MKDKRLRKIYRVTIIGSICNALLLTIKFAAGIVGNSSAMMADAVHSLSDFISDLVVLLFVKISGKPKDHRHNYGYGKYETLATAFIGFLLLFVGGSICWGGITKIWDTLYEGQLLEKPSNIALYAAVLSIAVKEILYQWTKKVGMAVNSQAVIANAWHHRSDAFSSIATTFGIAGAIFLGDQWRILDPIAATLVSILIIRMACQFIKSSIGELLEKSLPAEVEQEIIAIIAEFPEAHEPHKFRTRCIGKDYAVDFHIRFDKDKSILECHRVTTLIEQKIITKYGEGTIVIIHIEPDK